jgi:hypothetical protein
MSKTKGDCSSNGELAHSTSPKGLTTVAFLKAKYDEGADYLDIFMPIVEDALSNIAENSFVCLDIQYIISKKHGIALPRNVIDTLLKRFISKGIIKREFSLYFKIKNIPNNELNTSRAKFENKQVDLANGLIAYATQRELEIKSTEEALEFLISFLEYYKIDVILEKEIPPEIEDSPIARKNRIVAEYIRGCISEQGEKLETINEIIEGLIVYGTAFLVDISEQSKDFKDIEVYLDSTFLRQLLGFEGEANELLAKESVSALKAARARTRAFSITLDEIKSILSMYERNLVSSSKIENLRQTPMTRHFLQQRYKPSDMVQFSVTLESRLSELGIQVSDPPKHVAKYTLDERRLQSLLANEISSDEEQPRVIHDVNCVAAILTIRAGVKTNSLERSKAVFATTSSSVLQKIRLWWHEQNEGNVVAPAVNIRFLTNRAWLKKPQIATKLKVRELLVLCNTVLAPTKRTWSAFVNHLHDLESQKKLMTEEAVAILASELVQKSLTDLEGDHSDPDATTLDEIIEKVKVSYQEQSLNKVASLEEEKKLIEAKAGETNERLKLLHNRIGRNAKFVAKIIAGAITYGISIAVIIGVVFIAVSHEFHQGALGIFLGICLILFLLLELVGVLSHVRHLCNKVEHWILKKQCEKLGVSTYDIDE